MVWFEIQRTKQPQRVHKGKLVSLLHIKLKLKYRAKNQLSRIIVETLFINKPSFI